MNHDTNYEHLDMQMIKNKKSKIITSEEALRDIEPIDWSEEILQGEKKVILKRAKE